MLSATVPEKRKVTVAQCPVDGDRHSDQRCGCRVHQSIAVHPGTRRNELPIGPARFACSGVTHQRDSFASLDRQIEACQHGLLLGILEKHIFEFDTSRQRGTG